MVSEFTVNVNKRAAWANKTSLTNSILKNARASSLFLKSFDANAKRFDTNSKSFDTNAKCFVQDASRFDTNAKRIEQNSSRTVCF